MKGNTWTENERMKRADGKRKAKEKKKKMYEANWYNHHEWENGLKIIIAYIEAWLTLFCLRVYLVSHFLQWILCFPLLFFAFRRESRYVMPTHTSIPFLGRLSAEWRWEKKEWKDEERIKHVSDPSWMLIPFWPHSLYTKNNHWNNFQSHLIRTDFLFGRPKAIDGISIYSDILLSLSHSLWFCFEFLSVLFVHTSAVPVSC